MARRTAPGPPQTRQPAGGGGGNNGGANLADILERVLDKGIVIAGDIQVNLLDIELLTIKIRLVVASVERAKEMGIDWWERDPTLSAGRRELEDENRDLRARVEALERDRARELGDGRDPDDEPPDDEPPDDEPLDDEPTDDEYEEDPPDEDEDPPAEEDGDPGPPAGDEAEREPVRRRPARRRSSSGTRRG